MDLPGEFRARAQHCLGFSREAPTIEAQSHWVAMAQFWFNLAELAEHQGNENIGIHDAEVALPPDEFEPPTSD